MTRSGRKDRRPPHPPESRCKQRGGDLSPTRWGRGGRGCRCVNLNEKTSQQHLSPILGGEVAAWLCTQRVRGSLLLASLVLLLLPNSLRAQDIRAKAEANTQNVTLAEWVQVTITIEGPAPLRVELPKQLLTDDAHRAWRIQADKAEPKITPTTSGREQWRQVYRLNAW